MRVLLLALLIGFVPISFAYHHHHGYYGHRHHGYYYNPGYYYGGYPDYYYSRPRCDWRWDPYYGEYRCYRYRRGGVSIGIGF